MAPFVLDTFSGGTAGDNLLLHIGETGAVWVKGDSAPGNVILTPEGRIRPGDTTQSIYAAAGSPASPDYDVYATVFPKSLVSGQNVDLYGRYTATGGTSATRTLYLARRNEFAGRYELWKVINSAGTTLGTYTQALTAGLGAEMMLRMRGTTIQLLVDGVVRISVTDSAITAAGKAGLGFFTTGGGWSDTTGLHLDNFNAVDGAAISASPGTITVGTSGNAITLTGVNTAWTPGTPGSPTFTLSGGTGASITAQTVNSPTSATLTIAAGSATGTLTITDPSSGATTTITVAAVPPVTIAVTDATFLAGLSPYAWYRSGGSWVETAAEGNGGKWLFSLPASGYIKLNVVVSHLSGLGSGSYPVLAYSVDEGAIVTRPLLSTDTGIQIASGLAAGNHSVRVWLKSYDYAQDRWNSPKDARIAGFELPPGGAIVAHAGAVALRSKRMLLYSDSIGAGIFATATNASGGDALAAFPYALGAALDAEVGVLAYGGVGYAWDGQGNVPRLYNVATPASSSWDKYFSGQSRLVGGLFSPAPDYIAIMLGTNEGLNLVSDANVTAAAQGLYTVLRTAAPLATLFPIIPVGRYKASAITAAVTAFGDSNTHLIDLGTELSYGLSGPQGTPSRRSLDSVHPNPVAHAEIVARLVERVRFALGNGAVAPTAGGRRPRLVSL